MSFVILQVLLKIFSYLSHREVLKYAVVCKKWNIVSQDSRLWGFVSLRPEISGKCSRIFICHSALRLILIEFQTPSIKTT